MTDKQQLNLISSPIKIKDSSKNQYLNRSSVFDIDNKQIEVNKENNRSIEKNLTNFSSNEKSEISISKLNYLPLNKFFNNEDSNLDLKSNSQIENSNNIIKSNLKFSPLPKPDFSSIVKKDSIITYRSSYKMPKFTCPDSPIKTPENYPNTGGNTFKIGNKIVKKATCRKLNFFQDENDDYVNKAGNLNKNDGYNILNKINSKISSSFFEHSFTKYKNDNMNFYSEFKKEIDKKSPILKFDPDYSNEFHRQTKSPEKQNPKVNFENESNFFFKNKIYNQYKINNVRLSTLVDKGLYSEKYENKDNVMDKLNKFAILDLNNKEISSNNKEEIVLNNCFKKSNDENLNYDSPSNLKKSFLNSNPNSSTKSTINLLGHKCKKDSKHSEESFYALDELDNFDGVNFKKKKFSSE